MAVVNCFLGSSFKSIEEVLQLVPLILLPNYMDVEEKSPEGKSLSKPFALSSWVSTNSRFVGSWFEP
jgi:hypothetical protein